MFEEDINNYHLKAVIRETKSSVVHLAQYKPNGSFLVVKRSKEQTPTEFQLTQVCPSIYLKKNEKILTKIFLRTK